MYKYGPWENPSNYRDISFLNALCKIFVNIVNDRLCRWVDTFELEDENRASFQHGHHVYVYLSMCVYVYLSMYLYVYLSMYVCLSSWMYVYKHVCL